MNISIINKAVNSDYAKGCRTFTFEDEYKRYKFKNIELTEIKKEI